MGEVFLGRYEAIDEVGHGGMATVYRGTDRVLGRDVAIKVLHRHLCQRAEARERFAREARIIAKLRHPNIVEVYDFSGEDQANAFIVTEYVDGRSLSEFLQAHGPVLPEVAALVIASVGDALQHAHERGVIHRDVKPENIMVRQDGVLKLMDFGIAHVVDMEQLTVTGAIVGSPAHMSPEQVDGKALDARTDIFSLGTLFYLTASSAFPFRGDTASAVLKAIVDARPPDIRTLCHPFPDDLHAILTRMMARDPAERFASAREVVDALQTVTHATGLGSWGDELPRFLSQPAAYVETARTRVAEARLVQGRQQLRSGQLAAAIRTLDGVVALAPDHPDAARTLERARNSLRRRRLSWTAILLALAVIIVAGMAVGLYHWLPTMTQDPPSSEIPAEPSDPPAEIALRPPFADTILQPRRSMAVMASPHVRPLPKPSANGSTQTAKAQPIPVTVQAFPPAVQIFVDGRAAGFGSSGEMALAPGRHQVRLVHPNCEACRETSYSFNLSSDNPPKAPLRFSIGFKEALVIVRGPGGAQVLVNGVMRGQTNETLRIPTSQAAPQSATVAVRMGGQVIQSARTTLTPGKTVTLTLP